MLDILSPYISQEESYIIARFCLELGLEEKERNLRIREPIDSYTFDLYLKDYSKRDLIRFSTLIIDYILAVETTWGMGPLAIFRDGPIERKGLIDIEEISYVFEMQKDFVKSTLIFLDKLRLISFKGEFPSKDDISTIEIVLNKKEIDNLKEEGLKVLRHRVKMFTEYNKTEKNSYKL